ncbi:MAG: hypothetical protein ABS58_09285 [Mesorhizobium sp. SCN 65-20]|nr:MAG: hypothetical protein ABS58_09285 [Mesorhizobium sp. SCN 65-20]
MTSIRRVEGYIAAHGILVDIASSPNTDMDERVEIVLKMVKQPQVLAAMTAKVFDQIGEVPNIAGPVDRIAGREFALEYGDALYQMNQMRRRQGRDAMPIRFKDEDGTPDNVIYIADWLAARREAA